MTIKLEIVDGTTEIFDSANYKVSTIEDMHPMIVGLKVYDSGKLIFKKHRPFAFWYKHFTVNSPKVQQKIKEIETRNKQNTQKQNS